jgi:hypothetical protein
MLSEDDELITKLLTELHDRELTKLNGDLGQECPKLFHHTSLSAAKNILETGKLRLTDIRYLNDPQELNSGIEIAFECLEDFFKHQKPLNSLKIAYFRYLCFLVFSIKNAFSFESNYQEINEEYKSYVKKWLSIEEDDLKKFNIDTFIFCFSEDADNLRLWMPYSNDGQGVSLCFFQPQDDFKIIENVQLFLIRVCYKSKKDKISFLMNIFGELEKIYTISIKMQNYNHFHSEVFYALLYDVIACKDESYADENEWRVIFLKSEKHDNEIKYFEKNNVIKPYVEFELNKDEVEKIILGPKLEDIMNSESLKKIASSKGYINVSINKSKIQYRG